MKLNKIYQRDCLELIPQILDKSIDMILCDLPYGTTACKWDTIIPLKPLWEQYKRIIKDNGAIVLTASQPFTTILINSNLKMFKYELIWEKDRPTGLFTAKIQPMKAHENILIFGKGKLKFNPQKWEGQQESHKRGSSSVQSAHYKGAKFRRETIGTLKNPRSVLYFKKDMPSIHNTQKPVALFEYLIKTYTNEGDLVLDNCAGSGTTGVACRNLNRNFILIEKEPEYYKIAKARINAVPDRLF